VEDAGVGFERHASFEEGQAFAEEHGLECSAKTGANVREALVNVLLPRALSAAERQAARRAARLRASKRESTDGCWAPLAGCAVS
jgi:hypothetical protein